MFGLGLGELLIIVVVMGLPIGIVIGYFWGRSAGRVQGELIERRRRDGK
jgi:hypothetical protein